jgi:heme exporter protein C
MRNWWKILAPLSLFFVLILGSLTRLGPGILDVDEHDITPGHNSVKVTGYNTHFDDPTANVQAFLKAGKGILCAESVEILEHDEIVVAFNCPDTLPVGLLSVYVNNNIDGTVHLPSSIRVSGHVENPEANLPACDVKINTEEAAGFHFPFLPNLYETIRNLFWHVPMWFSMFLLMFISVVQSVRYLSNGNLNTDRKANSHAKVGIVFCILGLITGSIWARFTWGAWWVNDPQLNGAMVVFLIYMAYFILRSSIEDETQRARVAAIYNIFACTMLIVLLLILPKYTTSLHPGKDGSPAFSQYDLDNTLRMVFYPAVIGWMITGLWLSQLVNRYRILKERIDYGD